MQSVYKTDKHNLHNGHRRTVMQNPKELVKSRKGKLVANANQLLD